MSRLTITISDDRHRALKEASVQRDKTIGQLIEESLEFYGIKTREDARALVQRARRHSSQNRVTIAGEFCQYRYVNRLVTCDSLKVAQFQLGHAAAHFLFNQLCRDVIVRQDFQQIMTDAWLVVINVTR